MKKTRATRACKKLSFAQTTPSGTHPQPHQAMEGEVGGCNNLNQRFLPPKGPFGTGVGGLSLV
ncbi:MAG: hypothetical protein ACTSUQ_05105 [Candidatus Freyarchaeota archaeon]